MQLAVAADHAGFEMKRTLVAWLEEEGHQVVNLGPPRPDPVDDYPDVAVSLCREIQEGRVQRGILICGSGIGASVAANKMKGIRAGVAHDIYSAHQGVEHDDVNVLCLGARIIGIEVAYELVRAFLAARFSGEERHVRRLNKVLALEQHSG
ncbi:MAG: ribose 5-phosphate isomerase B [Acidobacteria bacterium]|nr:MAG: ribose 5-phosphate isomerase B [Acidobacteriota bacterium]TDI44530.1 MAG: ribose 5-phosphate isomerase B [Acidobacteriota bacterium]